MNESGNFTIITAIEKLYRTCENNKGEYFPSTELYNETWMLRLLIDQLKEVNCDKNKLFVPKDGKWFSEAQLPTQFRYPYPENRTHADAVIGHFEIEKTAGLKLKKDATHFVVIEAKMNSPLDSGVTNAPLYNQAARTVACMVESLIRAGIANPPQTLAFYVLAPEVKLHSDGPISKLLKLDHLIDKVKDRVKEYNGSKDVWFETFKSFVNKITIDHISWESQIAVLKGKAPEKGKIIDDFYTLCKKSINSREK